MSLIGTTIYRDHHQMNTRGEVLFGLTRRFIWTRQRGPRPSALIAFDLACPDACFIRLMSAARMAVFKSSRRDLVHLAIIRHCDVIGCVSVYLGIQTVPAGR
jgi:hypothetical protein